MPALSDILETLERFHGKQEARWPVDPYRFIVWWQCGYPPSEERCNRGWEALQRMVGVAPAKLLAAKHARLAAALEAGGIVPQLRATRLQEIGRRVQQEFGDDLDEALALLDSTGRRRALKTFPGIGDPGADRILLFGRLEPAAAVPSNCPHVLVRIESGNEAASYSVSYARAQAMLTRSVPQTFTALTRAYLLLQQHGRLLCKRERPKCDLCPVAKSCAYARQRVRTRKS